MELDTLSEVSMASEFAYVDENDNGQVMLDVFVFPAAEQYIVVEKADQKVHVISKSKFVRMILEKSTGDKLIINTLNNIQKQIIDEDDSYSMVR